VELVQLGTIAFFDAYTTWPIRPAPRGERDKR
jgi:hypothetical protein